MIPSQYLCVCVHKPKINKKTLKADFIKLLLLNDEKALLVSILMVKTNNIKLFWDVIFEVTIEYLKPELITYVLKAYHKFNNYHLVDYVNNQEVRNLLAQVTIVMYSEEKDINVTITNKKCINKISTSAYNYIQNYSHKIILTPTLIGLLAQVLFGGGVSVSTLHDIITSPEKILPSILSKSHNTNPIWIIWQKIYLDAEKYALEEQINLIIINDLKQVFIHFLSKNKIKHAILACIMAIEYVKGKKKEHKIDIMSRAIIQGIMNINKLYII